MTTLTTPLSLDLSGKIAVVTGATGQLGRVMVRTLAQCGADVAINYLKSADMAAQLQAEITAMGRRALTVQADVTDAASVLAMRDAVTSELGAADIIVNNAVIQYDWKGVLEQSPADYESQFRSCVLHNVLMAQCAMQVFAGQSAYAAGKRGMDGVLRVLAKEVGAHGITVNQVAPGWTISDRDRAAGTEKNEGYSKSVPLGRRGTDQEIANVVAFLASDLASYVTGVYLPVCGGNVMPTI